MRKKQEKILRNNPWKTVIIYIIFGMLWITYSDYVLSMFVKDPGLYQRLQTVKGSFYVFLTAGLLYLLIRAEYTKMTRLGRHIMQQNDELEASNEELIAMEQELNDKFNDVVQQQSFINAVFDSTKTAIAIWHLDGTLIDVNDYCANLMGMAKMEMVGQKWTQLHVESVNNQPLEQLVKQVDTTRDVELKLKSKDGRTHHMLWKNASIQSPIDGELCIASFGIDITKEKLQEQRLELLAYHDMLTGMANRVALYQYLEKATRKLEPLVLYFVDVDNFSMLNDLHGHEYGDIFLRSLVKDLNEQFSEEDLYRWGGDDFIIVQKMWPGAATDDVIDKTTTEILAIANKEWRLKDYLYTPTVSVGIVKCPDHGNDKGELIKHLDLALNHAKSKGRSKVVVYHEALSQKLSDEIVLENRIADSIADEKFYLLYQPIYDLETMNIIGAEALIRWPYQSDYSTDVFIGLAERTGQVVQIDQLVIKEAFKMLKKHDLKDTDFVLSINLSAQSFSNPAILDTLMTQADHYGIAPSSIKIEITEHTFMVDFVQSKIMIESLKRIGFKLALDDFGTRYSSLNYLSQLPFDQLKIDRSYINEVLSGEKSTEIVRSVLGLAKSLGLTTVAEGIEEKAQLTILKEMGCDLGQGYYMSKPITEGELMGLVKKT